MAASFSIWAPILPKASWRETVPLSRAVRAESFAESGMAEDAAAAAGAAQPAGSALEVLLVFLRLGLTSFGGPVAHLGYFRTEFVERRRWLGDAAFSDMVALCQFLPGPASSQTGMMIGLARAGYGGMAAAWLGFTTPSAVLMALF